jgi:hypothetical protein
VHEAPVVPPDVRRDEHVAHRAVLAPHARGLVAHRLPVAQPAQQRRRLLAIDVELGDAAADVFARLVAEHRELVSVRPENPAVGPDAMDRLRGAVQKIGQLALPQLVDLGASLVAGRGRAVAFRREGSAVLGADGAMRFDRPVRRLGDRIRAAQRKRVPLAEIVPQLLETHRRAVPAAAPQKRHHFAEDRDPRIALDGGGDERLDDVRETALVGPSLDANVLECSLGVDCDVAAARAQLRDLHATRRHATLDRVGVRRRRERNRSGARPERARNEIRGAFHQHGSVLVELDEMVARSRVVPARHRRRRHTPRPLGQFHQLAPGTGSARMMGCRAHAINPVVDAGVVVSCTRPTAPGRAPYLGRSRARASSNAIGSTDSAMMPSVTSPKLRRTQSTLPNQ